MLAAWFSTFFEKPLVSRVNRRIPIRMVRFLPLDVAGAELGRVGVAGHGVYRLANHDRGGRSGGFGIDAVASAPC